MSQQTIITVSNFISGVSALVAAGLWFWASRTKTPKELRSLIHSSIGGGAFEGDLADLARGVSKQSRLNAYAALAAGISALFQFTACLTPIL
jgi:hypothetical protein